MVDMMEVDAANGKEISNNIPEKEEKEMIEDELVERMRTYSVLKWCGMPASLNPRKLAKKGFFCLDSLLV